MLASDEDGDTQPKRDGPDRHEVPGHGMVSTAANRKTGHRPYPGYDRQGYENQQKRDLGQTSQIPLPKELATIGTFRKNLAQVTAEAAWPRSP